MERLDLVLKECLDIIQKEVYDYIVKKINYKVKKPRKRKEILCRPVLMISDSSDNETLYDKYIY